MEYSLKLTNEFMEEFDEICKYISEVLKAPDASKRLRERVMYNVLLLKKTPNMYEAIEKLDRVKKKYRRFAVNNYVVLYTVDEEMKIIYIAHIYYGGRNYIDDLL